MTQLELIAKRKELDDFRKSTEDQIEALKANLACKQTEFFYNSRTCTHCNADGSSASVEGFFECACSICVMTDM